MSEQRGEGPGEEPGEEPGKKSGRGSSILIGAVLVAFAVGWVWLGPSRSDRPTKPAARPAPSAPAPASPLDRAEPAAPHRRERNFVEVFTPAAPLPDGSIELSYGEKPSFALSDLADSGPIRIAARLPVPSSEPTSLPTLVLFEGNNIFVGEAPVEEPALDRVRIELDRSDLAPGIYVVTVRTNEPEILPMRRFRFELRGRSR